MIIYDWITLKKYMYYLFKIIRRCESHGEPNRVGLLLHEYVKN